MKTIELKDLNRIIEINYSDFGNPRENDNLGTMVCFHGRYNLGDKHNYNSNDYNSFGEMEKAIIRKENVAVSPIFISVITEYSVDLVLLDQSPSV